MVASTRDRQRHPEPSCFTASMPPAANPANTATMRSAAEVMMRPVRWSPTATAWSLSPVSS